MRSKITGAFFHCGLVFPGGKSQSEFPVARSFYSFGSGPHFLSKDEVDPVKAKNLRDTFGIDWRDINEYLGASE